ncbi:RNA-guided endonuclease TnpB family protein [Streptomyces sp. 5-6(2022)]|uniref:RNA-guided endonuclease InsQ/TnpB family protein n=1 Tax=Streptomyces sp. 5-6(2022) TaxID=2936510 RepID=UPI0023B997E9|nr:RNA-guided endonuclease TnpB family protein [Streptomyces sp. 5-6(2022)]
MRGRGRRIAAKAVQKTEELAYLNDVSSVPLQQTLRHLQGAFTNFFARRAKYPRFKSRKRSRNSAEYITSGFRFREGKLTLAKMSEPLDIVWSRPFPEHASLSTVTVSQDAAGRWFVSLLVEDSAVQPLPANDRAVGIDAGLDYLRKARGNGANRVKARRKVAKVHARIADRRRDHLHKITTRLVRENQTLVIEDLTVRNLLRNGKLSRAISDAAWSEFRSMLEYKAAWYGRDVIAVDRWFPSSKLCSNCGALRDKMPLSVRTWRCDCGATHDRDVNAAKNLLAAGLAVSACGAGVRPQRESSRTGQSVTKQESPRREP